MKKTTKWKYLFMVLLFINIAVVSFIGWKVFIPAKEPEVEMLSFDSDVVFTVSSNKETLATYINQSIKQRTKNKPAPYEIRLTDAVEIKGKLQVFSRDVPYLLKMKPSVLKNGDVLLDLTSIQLGGLKLPVQLVLSGISDMYDIPEWVTVHPNEKSIFIGVTQMEMKNQSRIKVKSFDLERNNISFKLFMPTGDGKS